MECYCVLLFDATHQMAEGDILVIDADRTNTNRQPCSSEWGVT